MSTAIATQTVETPGQAVVVDAASQVPAQKQPKPHMAVGHRGIEIRSWDDLWRFANALATSDLAPKDYKGKAGNVVIAVQLGMELGISPMQAVQNIAPINGRPSVWGDLALALCEASGLLETKKEWFEGKFGENDFKAIIETKRRGREPHRTEFSIEDAKIAKLWGKAGPWETNPKRMLQMRARGFNLRDQFPDVLKGMILAEEAIDITPDEPVAIDPGQTSALGDRLDAAASGAREIDSAADLEVAASTQADGSRPAEGDETNARDVASDRVLGLMQRMNAIRPGAAIEALKKVAGQETLDDLEIEKLEEIGTVFESAIADLEAQGTDAAETESACGCPDGPTGKHVKGCPALAKPAAELPKGKQPGFFGDK